jgi:uncharacterized membrane protein YqhA
MQESKQEPMRDPDQAGHRSLVMRAMGYSRYIIVLAVLCTFLGSAVLVVIGTFEMLSSIWHVVFSVPRVGSGELKLAMIESVETFLVATVLLLIALGLYQLFVSRLTGLPPWLQTHSVDDLEKRLAGMIVVVMAVSFLTQVIQWTEGVNILWLGLATGSVILAVSIFLYQESRHGGNKT